MAGKTLKIVYIIYYNINALAVAFQRKFQGNNRVSKSTKPFKTIIHESSLSENLDKGTEYKNSSDSSKVR